MMTEEEVMKDFWDGYTEFLRNQKPNIYHDALCDLDIMNILSQGIPKDRITILGSLQMKGKSVNWMERYVEYYQDKQTNRIRFENLEKMLND